jgi:CobQ-like glutamine amidotransferase family enzyme
MAEVGRMTAQLTIANLYPLCSTAQGDEGNARALRHRAELRGLTASIITTYAGKFPHADIYLLGGAWHPEQPRLVELLGGPDGLGRAVDDGAVVLGVNSGFQVLGEWFDTPDGTRHAGLGLLGARTTHAPLVEGPVGTLPNVALGLPAMTGYENHDARTELDAEIEPLTRLDYGVGNGMPSRSHGSHGSAVAAMTRSAVRGNAGYGVSRIANDPDPAAVRRAQAAANAHRRAHAGGRAPANLSPARSSRPASPVATAVAAQNTAPYEPAPTRSYGPSGHGLATHDAGHLAHGGGHTSHSGAHASYGGAHSTIAVDGAIYGHVIGTYLHGPVLERNPQLADLLLGWALGRTLDPIDEPGAIGRPRRGEDRPDRYGWIGAR